MPRLAVHRFALAIPSDALQSGSRQGFIIGRAQFHDQHYRLDFLTGALARWFYPGGVHMGFILTTLLGIAGSFAGGFIGGLFTRERDMMRPTPAGFIMSIIGAMVLIFIAHRLGYR